MNLTPQQTEQVRLSILRYTLSALSLGLITAYLKAEGFRALTKEQVADEIQYLLDKKLLTKSEKVVSPELAHYRITAEGRDYLALQGIE